MTPTPTPLQFESGASSLSGSGVVLEVAVGHFGVSPEVCSEIVVPPAPAISAAPAPPHTLLVILAGVLGLLIGAALEREFGRGAR